MRKKVQILYIAVFLLLCLIPSAGLLIAGSETSLENRTLADFPQLKTEEGWNQDYLQELGTYFEDHFAFRNEWVTAFSLLEGKLFGVSSQDSVIVGTEGWLYYSDSLGDYQGTSQMTDRQLFDLAHTLSMVQDYVEGTGAAFVFTIAPNKNSLYGEHMPYYYQYFRTGENNLSRILPWLESEGVHYVNLYQTLLAEDEVLYHKRDSHWNNKGAAIAADALLTALGTQHASYRDRAYEVRTDFEGDLDTMLYPLAITKEEEIYYDPLPQFDYLDEVESNFDPQIHTMSSSGTGSLVIYRDSFGNALLPFLAEAFEKAYFTRGIPYYLSDLYACQATAVIIERAERFLPDMIQDPPMMQGPVISFSELGVSDFVQEIPDLNVENQGVYTVLTGTLPEDGYDTTSRIFIRINGVLTLEAFPVSDASGQEGFQLAIASSLLNEAENQFELYVSRES